MKPYIYIAKTFFKNLRDGSIIFNRLHNITDQWIDNFEIVEPWEVGQLMGGN